jgi:hypothetical protein
MIAAAHPRPSIPGRFRDRLRYVGETLYGRRWRAAIARDLHVSRRSIDRWMCGRGRAANIDRRLVEVLEHSSKQLLSLRRDMARFVSTHQHPACALNRRFSRWLLISVPGRITKSIV